MSRGKPIRGRKGKISGRKPRLHLRRDKHPGKELRRIAILQLKAAIKGIGEGNLSTESVHDARTYIKKVRAVLQLASPLLDKDHRNETLGFLRDAAAKLGPLRDSEVRVLTLDSLLEREALDPSEFTGIRAGLADMAKQCRANEVRRIPRVMKSLSRALRSVECWDLDGLDGGDLRKCVRKTYRRGRTSLQLVVTEAGDEHFHTWRKQVKRLWYQLRMTAPFWPREGAPLIAATGKIGSLAGEERDLTLLEESLSLGRGTKASVSLGGLIAAIRPGLRAEALADGQLFYSGKSGEFVGPLDL